MDSIMMLAMAPFGLWIWLTLHSFSGTLGCPSIQLICTSYPALWKALIVRSAEVSPHSGSPLEARGCSDDHRHATVRRRSERHALLHECGSSGRNDTRSVGRNVPVCRERQVTVR